MKSKNLISLLLTTLFMVSCTNEMDELVKDSSENVSGKSSIDAFVFK